ncbi:MAG: flagellar biosynthetic protein FliO [Alicyclobacillus sp.]|nr:flagellar biosynthetic protein FliO [Alicyclobacillus sp.]
MQVRFFSCIGAALLVCVLCCPARVYASAPTPAARPFSNPAPAVINLLLSLAVVVVLIIVLIRFLASRSRISQQGAIRVVAATQVAPNRSVQIIQIQDQRYLIGVGNDITLLADVTDVRLDGTRDNEQENAVLFKMVMERSLAKVRARHDRMTDGEVR